jgi:hypothetical protein
VGYGRTIEEKGIGVEEIGEEVKSGKGEKRREEKRERENKGMKKTYSMTAFFAHISNIYGIIELRSKQFKNNRTLMTGWEIIRKRSLCVWNTQAIIL